MERIRAERERRKAVLEEHGFDGPHAIDSGFGGLFGSEYAICRHCGAMVSLAGEKLEDGSYRAWAFEAHLGSPCRRSMQAAKIKAPQGLENLCGEGCPVPATTDHVHLHGWIIL
jgi:hypothetical protein